MPTSRAPGRKKYQVPALQRAFAILDSLNQTSFGLTVQEISEQHEIPYSTAFYLLETMSECGYAERNEDSGGPNAKVKKPEIPLAWPTYVAVSDTHAYVNDTVSRRVVKVKLNYAAEAACALP